MEYIEVKWSLPFQIDGVRCCVAEHDSGWLIASSDPPRFCFWAKTQVEAEDIAERGIKYWRTVKLPPVEIPRS